jgi:hypothetical protein
LPLVPQGGPGSSGPPVIDPGGPTGAEEGNRSGVS